MPTDRQPGEDAGSPPLPAGPAQPDDMVFATQDLGRVRDPLINADGADTGFAPAPRPATAPPVTAGDGFVIRDPQTVAPMAALDTFVVGPTTAPGPSTNADPCGPSAGGSTPHPFLLQTPASARDEQSADVPWLVVEEPSQAALVPSSPSWGTRGNSLAARSAEATVLRLREEAVDVSWKSAWVAVVAADPRLGSSAAG